jgi:NADPH:quinone reductase-like Zn-dependent oxidoreductase
VDYWVFEDRLRYLAFATALQPLSAAAHSSAVKAAVRTEYGPPDVVHVVDTEQPTIQDNELLVRVHATTVNRTDCAARAADPFIWRLFAGLIRPKMTILGNEFAGEVAAIGRGVTSFNPG